MRWLRGDQPQRPGTRPYGWEQVGFAWGTQQPHGALRGFFERFQQHVRGALGHAICILDHNDTVATLRRGEMRTRNNVTHIVNTNLHLLRGEHRSIRMSAREHLMVHLFAIFRGARNERRRKPKCEV